MEEPVKDQSSAPLSKGKGSSKLRYPLRSAAKVKEEGAAAELSNSSVPKRGKLQSSVSKSVGVLDLSAKDKSGKPPRRNSIAAKSAVSPLPRPLGSITPISEARATRSGNIQAKSGTPNSDVSKSSSRKKFSVLSSASYWLSQIKLSESAAKHSISLGLFKLALEARCEPLQRMRDELKAYARKHNLTEFGEPANELFESYNISEDLESQVSETISQVFEEGTRSSDDDVHSSSSLTGARKLKPKSLDVDAASAKASPAVAKLGKKSATPKDNLGPKIKGPSTRKSATVTAASENVGHSVSKKSQKPTKKELDVKKGKMQKQAKDAAIEKDLADTPVAEPLQENKENMDSPQMEETSVIEV